MRAGKTPPANSTCFGWGGWIKGSETGNYLMGAGNYLAWADDPALRAGVQSVVDGISALRSPTGWLWAFDESDIWANNLPDYCASWVTRGLLDAHAAGITGALGVARDSISLFNNHSKLPTFLPPNGGPDPVLPYPDGCVGRRGTPVLRQALALRRGCPRAGRLCAGLDRRHPPIRPQLQQRD